MKRYGKLTLKDDDVLGKIIFSDPEKEREWEELDPNIKKSVQNNLKMYIKHLSTDVAVETLAHVLNEVLLRIDKLENHESKSA